MMKVLEGGLLLVKVDVSLIGPEVRPEAELVLGALHSSAKRHSLLTITDT